MVDGRSNMRTQIRNNDYSRKLVKNIKKNIESKHIERIWEMHRWALFADSIWLWNLLGFLLDAKPCVRAPTGTLRYAGNMEELLGWEHCQPTWEAMRPLAVTRKIGLKRAHPKAMKNQFKIVSNKLLLHSFAARKARNSIPMRARVFHPSSLVMSWSLPSNWIS